MHTSILKIKSENPEKIAKAISVDNLGQETSMEGDFVVTSAESSSVRTLLATLDDILFCTMVSKSVIENG